MITISERTEYTACHLTPKVKNALRAEVAKSNTSMSLLIFYLLREKLIERGYKFDEVAK